MVRKVLAVIAVLAFVAVTMPIMQAEAGSYNGKSCSNRTSADMKQGYRC